VTPETIRTISDLRREFYASFIAAMCTPVKLGNSPYGSSFSIASWIDENQYLNYVNIYAHTAPDELQSERTLILRVSINRGAGDLTAARKGPNCQGLNRKWWFELTLLPEEMLDFLPWVIDLVEAKTKNLLTSVREAPHPLTFNESNLLQSTKAWTQKAQQSFYQ
jgi:hypothetical protein